MKAVEVSFRLSFGVRKDNEAEVHVGYCPLLNLYSQGTTQEEAEAAIVDAAQAFIVTCYGRDILHRVLRERGMNRAVAAAARTENQQFIAVHEIQEYDRQFERDVPIELMASASVGMDMANCRL